MRMHKERIVKDDGRYLIYYTFEPAEPRALQTEPRQVAAEPSRAPEGKVPDVSGSDDV